MRVSAAALAFLISSTLAFSPPLSKLCKNKAEIAVTCLRAARPEFPTPKVTSATRISSDSTESKTIMEARHSLLEIKTSAEQAREHLAYLQQVANVVETYLQDESTPLRANFQHLELQNVKEATNYLVNIQLAMSDAKDYLSYLEKMSREIKVYLTKFEQEYKRNKQNEKATFHLNDLEETADAARDYLKYLQTVSSVVQTFLVDPSIKVKMKGIKEIQDFLPKHTAKTATREEKNTHSRRIIPPPAPSLQVDSNISVKGMNKSDTLIGSKVVGAYLEALRPSSTRLTAVNNNNMEYLDTVASSSKESGISTGGGTISWYLDSIDPQQRRKSRYLSADDLKNINQGSKALKSPLDYETKRMNVSPTRRRNDDNNDYDRAKAAAAAMMDVPAGKPPPARRRPSANEAFREDMKPVTTSPSNKEGGSNAGPSSYLDQTTQPPTNPTDWPQAKSIRATTTSGSSSSLIGETQMPSDWMQPKGPMADLFGGGPNARSPQQPPQRTSDIQRPAVNSPPSRGEQVSSSQAPATEESRTENLPPTSLENETTNPTQYGEWRQPKTPMAGSESFSSKQTSNIPRQPRDLLNEVRALDDLSIKERNSPSATTFSDWVQPKGPMVGGSSSSSAVPNDWMQPKSPLAGGGDPVTSSVPLQASRRPRDLQNEARILNSVSSKEQKFSREPPPVPPEAYLEQMASPNETIDWSNYNAGNPAITSSSSAPTNPEPYYDGTPIETVDWSYLDPGKRSPASAAAAAATAVPTETGSSSYAGQNPWVTFSQAQAALSSNPYQEQTVFVARRRATTLPPVPTSIRSFLDQVKLSSQRGRQIDWSRTKDTKRIRIAPPSSEVSDYPNPLPQTSQPVDWTSVAEASTIPEPGTGGILQRKPYITRENEESLAETKYFFLEEPVENFFFTKVGGTDNVERHAGEPISPKLPILGSKYMDQLEQAARKNPLNLREELEKRRLLEDDQEDEKGYFERTFETGEMINGRLAMFFLLLGLWIEFVTGATLPAQVGEMGQEWNNFRGGLNEYSRGQKVVKTPAAPKLERAIHETGSAKIQQSVQATVSAPTPPPPAVTKEEKEETSNSAVNDQAAQPPTAEVTANKDEVVKAKNQQPTLNEATVPSPPVALQSPLEAVQGPQQGIRSQVETVKVQQQVTDSDAFPSAPPIIVESSIQESSKISSAETAKEQVKEEEPVTVTNASSPPVVEKPPPVEASKSPTSSAVVEKEEEADIAVKPEFPNLEDWSF